VSGRIRSIEKFNDLIGNRTRDLPVCSIVRQPTMLLRAAPIYMVEKQTKQSSKMLTSVIKDDKTLRKMSFFSGF
jgi:hypothetical protein